MNSRKRAKSTANRAAGKLVIFLAAFVLSATLQKSPAAARTTEENYIALRSFMAPASDGAGSSQKQTAITVLIEVSDIRDASLICRYSPRILDAIMIDIHKSPIVLSDGKLTEEALDAIGNRLLGPLNGVLPKRLVSRVHIHPYRLLKKGRTGARVPFSNLMGCHRL